MLQPNQIYTGDCFELLKQIDSNTIDLVVTSPPYNLACANTDYTGLRRVKKINYEFMDDDLSEESYQKQQIELLNELHRVIKTTGSVFYNHKIRSKKGKRIHPLSWIQQSKLIFNEEIIWQRGGITQPLHHRFHVSKELIFWLVKTKNYYFNEKYRNFNDIWRMNADTSNKHPASFPIGLPKRCILATTKEGDLVLDPYCGSGTTLVVANMLGRKYIGFDLNQKFIEMTQQRLKMEKHIGLKNF